MNVVIVVDSFKGSLTSLQAGQAVKEAAQKVWQEARVTVLPVADGGEGTLDALTAGLGGEVISVTVTGPDGQPVAAQYGILPDGTAVMEMAAAAGITLMKEKDPMTATTYGVGEMIADAIVRGCRKFLVGIGGSATNDGGVGMLTALGFGFLDEKGAPIPLGGGGLGKLHSIRREHALPQLKDCSFRIACDVTNPLCGDNGCSAVFGPQKGATPEMVKKLDSDLARFASLSGGDASFPGTGAAGGLGYAFLTFTNAALESGIQLVLDIIHLEDYIKEADLVITGEGKLDGQTVMGKTPIGVARLAKKYGKRVIAFCGAATEEAKACLDHGIDAYYAVTPPDMPLADAMKPEIAYENLAKTACRVFAQE